MLKDQVSPSQEAEREELVTVAEALSRSPRLSRLLRYLGEKYFQGEIDQLHEYNIATEVFGRSKTASTPEKTQLRGRGPPPAQETQRVLRHRGKESPHPTINSVRNLRSGVYPPGGPGSVQWRKSPAQSNRTADFERRPSLNHRLIAKPAERSGPRPPWSRGSQYALMAAVLLIAAVESIGSLMRRACQRWERRSRSCSGHCAGVPASAGSRGRRIPADSHPCRIHRRAAD